MNEDYSFSLKQYNTFGIDVKSGCFVELFDEKDYEEFVARYKGGDYAFFVLGGGSNVVFTRDILSGEQVIIVHPVNHDIRVVERGSDHCLVEAGAGTIWDDFVDFCVDNGMYGAENLAGIPGTVGAAPVQNIGAYGAEAKDVIERVHVFNLHDGSQRWLENSECHFGYRYSVFKEFEETRYIVDRVVFRLRNSFVPDLRYKALADNWDEKKEREEVARMKSECGSVDADKELARRLAGTVRAVRDSKLPNPKEIGSAGSFFKNPVVDSATFERIKTDYPNVVSFPAADGMYKLSAGWLIEQCGWKGRNEGAAGVYEKQALVLVNRGGCTGNDVVQLARKIIMDVWRRFGVTLEPEAIILDERCRNISKEQSLITDNNSLITDERL